MSIEVSNESGVEVDEVALTTLGRFVLDQITSTRSPNSPFCWSTRTRWPRCTSSGWICRGRPT